MACTTQNCCDWIERLQEAGIIPQDTRRIIVDIPLDGLVSVYYECIAHQRMFTIDLADMLGSAQTIGVADVPREQPEPLSHNGRHALHEGRGI